MNKYTLSSVLIFAAGAVIGSLVSWRLTKDYYKNIADEEIADVKERFSQMTAMHREIEKAQEEITEEVTPPATEVKPSFSRPSKPDIYGLSALASRYSSDRDSKPYLITPDEFGDKYDEGYETETLTYYADGVLADDADVTIDDVDAMVGLSSLGQFGIGVYDDDSVYVRNDKHKADYEILKDSRTYEAVVGSDSSQESE